MKRKELIKILNELLQNENWIIEDDTLYNLVSDLLLELKPLDGDE